MIDVFLKKSKNYLMSKAIYITTNEPHSGKSAITLGMMEYVDWEGY